MTKKTNKKVDALVEKIKEDIAHGDRTLFDYLLNKIALDESLKPLKDKEKNK